MWRRIHALIFLGWRYFLHLLKAVSPFHRRPGLEKFRQNYLPDGITFYSPGERAAMPRMERCIGCDACLHAFFLREKYDPRQATPRDLAISLSRSSPDYKAARRILAGWKDLENFSELCPRGVDLAGITALMRRHLSEYDAHVPTNRKAA
ncbi:MAG: hypothetical protein AB1405_09795 [Bdellovibrionota bacterium]